eukprot:3401442-Heterocapsa_arctica.AAC.1
MQANCTLGGENDGGWAKNGIGQKPNSGRNAVKRPFLQTRKRYTGWPSRGKRFGEAEKSGPTTYYPPASHSGTCLLYTSPSPRDA